jgi:hypothetical protein
MQVNDPDQRVWVSLTWNHGHKLSTKAAPEGELRVEGESLRHRVKGVEDEVVHVREQAINALIPNILSRVIFSCRWIKIE